LIVGFRLPIFPEEQRYKTEGLMGFKVTQLHDDLAALESRWLWYPYIPADTLSIISGDPGVGKSWVVAFITAAVTNGLEFPGQVQRLKPQRVLLASVEDNVGATLVPRLRQLNANLNNVAVIEEGFKLSPRGLRQLEETIGDYDANILFIDPIFSYLAKGTDTDKQVEVGDIMDELRRIAERKKTAIIGVRHLRKGAPGKSGGSDIYRGMGSIGFTASARSEMLCEMAPKKRKVFRHIKVNNAPLGPALEYRINHGDEPQKSIDPVKGVLLVQAKWTNASFEWLGEFEPPEDLKIVTTRGVSKKIEEFLKRELAQGPRWASDILAQGRAHGYTERSLQRSADKVNIKKTRNAKGWLWTIENRGGDHRSEAFRNQREEILAAMREDDAVEQTPIDDTLDTLYHEIKGKL
jgi:hypothetical protein